MLTRQRTDETVADAMHSRPKVLDDGATVDDVRVFFRDDHVHAALIVRAGILLAVLERSDVELVIPGGGRALTIGRLGDRVVRADTPVRVAQRLMALARRRRLAVVGADGELLGLLCLKRSGSGFCSDDDVAARASDPY